MKTLTAGRSLAFTPARVSVPFGFAALCLAGAMVAHISPSFLLSEALIRFARNGTLVLALLLPILAGLGLNFGIVVGAMAGQIAVILVVSWGIGGLPGLALAWIVSTPIAASFGLATGWLFNRAKGREMVTGLIAGFFANGLYQIVFLFMVGSVIPFHDRSMLLPQGYGLRNTIDLSTLQYAMDDLLPVHVALPGIMVRIPLATLVLVTGFCLLNVGFLRTKLGQELRAIGQDPHVAAIAGIPVDRDRVIATAVSTVLAAWGQILFLQNLGTVNTYNSHEQVGMFAIAALLVSGATVTRATVGQAVLGTLLFHALFIVSPLAGKALAGDAQIGEHFRVFIAYAVITGALVLHAWKIPRAAHSVSASTLTRAPR